MVLSTPVGPKNEQNAHRNLQLDVLRGIAILMVLGCHSIYLRTPTWDEALYRPGWSGVDLFFVVSGFLISGLLFSEYRRTGRIRFRRFAVRRALKIYPAFYALVLLTLIFRVVRHHGHMPPEFGGRLLHDLFFVQSYWEGTWGHFWSLSVEEHFYILLPVTLWFLMRFRRESGNPFRFMPWLFLSVAGLLLAARLLTARFLPFQWQTHLFPTHLRIDSLLFGVLLSYFFHFHRERFSMFVKSHLTPILCAAALLLSPMFFIGQYDRWMYTYGFTSLYLGYGCLLIGLLHLSITSFPAPVLACLRVVGYVGTFSYSIYLWHLPWLFVVLRLKLTGWTTVSLGLFYAGSIVLGIVTGKLIEFPVLRLRERLFPRSSPLPVPSLAGAERA